MFSDAALAVVIAIQSKVKREPLAAFRFSKIVLFRMARYFNFVGQKSLDGKVIF